MNGIEAASILQYLSASIVARIKYRLSLLSG